MADSFHLSWIDAVAVYALPGINITGRVRNSGQFQVQFNGDASSSYSVIGTTDLFLPLTNWPVMGPAVFQGNNSFGVSPSLNQPQQLCGWTMWA